MLTVLPCGGLGELDPKGDTMEIRCQSHRIWERDPRTGLYIFDLSFDDKKRETRLFKFRDTKGCGAVSDLDAGGVRVTVRWEEAREDAA